MGEKREPEREERGESEECSPLYRMDLTSEADIFIRSPSRKSNNFVLRSEEEEGSMSSEEDTEETPVMKRIVVMKVKGEKVRPAVKDVKGNEGKIPSEPCDLKRNQTKGMLLREQITTTRDHLEIDKIAREISNCTSDGL